jgi:hypothetical protein
MTDPWLRRRFLFGLMLRSRTKCGVSKHEAGPISRHHGQVQVPPSPFETLTRLSLRSAGLAPQDEGDGERGGCSAKLKPHHE